MKRKRLLLVALICGLLTTLFPLAATAAPSPSTLSQEPECNPRALFLADLMGVDCSVLMGYQADGVGFGVIMKAYFLSQVFPGLDWMDLVARHMSEEGLGWGQIMKAYALATVLPLTAQELLDLRAQGMGWGEIFQEHREGPGKPPWAGQGPPPWAHGGRCPPKSRSPRCAE